uniref:Uncharacterized protein n=1 Tax=Sphaerodactylus townsendi TaxID=933632 RepID=A0ACB8EF04_9SAUR
MYFVLRSIAPPPSLPPLHPPSVLLSFLGEDELTHPTPPPAPPVHLLLSLAELHTLQALCGCPVVAEGQCSKRRFRFAYDGKDIIWFEEETHTWAASVPRGQVIKSMLETKGTLTQIDKDCLEECSLWLQRFLEYENKTLQRTGLIGVG